jgi:hypothetical protein
MTSNPQEDGTSPGGFVNQIAAARLSPWWRADVSTLVLADGFQDLSQWSEVDTGSDLAVVDTIARYGSTCADCFLDDVTAAYLQASVGSVDQFYMSLWVWHPLLAAIPNVTPINFFLDNDLGVTTAMYLEKLGANMAIHTDVFGASSGYTTAWQTGEAWHHVEIEAKINTASGVKVWADSTLIYTGTSGASSNLETIRILDTSGCNWGGEHTYWDGFEFWSGPKPTQLHFGSPSASYGYLSRRGRSRGPANPRALPPIRGRMRSR